VYRLAPIAIVFVGLAACGSTRTGLPAPELVPALEDLPAPSWRVVARRNGRVLLAANRTIVRGIARRAPSRDPERSLEYPTLIFENSRLRQGPVARADWRILGTDGARDTVRLYSLEFEGRPVLFTQAGEGPELYESPAEPGTYVIESGDRLWLVAPTGVTRLTSDTVQGIARDTLQSQQREGVRHLFWAAAPLWALDGAAVAYVTNRTWMLDRSSGQEVWLADVRTRRERPFLSERGQFFAPRGWLGPALVYEARRPGIYAADARTGSRRTISPAGSVDAFAATQPRVLYMTRTGDAARAHILTERGVVDIPDPPRGEHLQHGATFSPRGDRLLLGTIFARDSGFTRALYVLDLGTERLTQLMQWSVREDRRHPAGIGPGLASWLDDSTLLLTQFDRGTGLESSTLVRLRSRSRIGEIAVPPRRLARGGLGVSQVLWNRALSTTR
jgi:hypothetical protein